MAAMIEIDNLGKRFGAITAVAGISLKVDRGEVLGFLGPNGAGKSTTMKMIAGFLSPTSGTARVCGFDVVEHPIEVKRRIGYLPEGAPAYPDMTAEGFLKFCAVMAGVLAMPPQFAHVIARELTRASRVPVVWLEAQDCAGNSEALLRAEKPTVAEVLLDTLSLEHHELLMAPSGISADKSIEDVMAAFPSGYIAVVEGAIPLADGGVYCTIGGKTFAEFARETCEKALAVVAVGSCAWDGGIPAARGGITGAVGVNTWLAGSGVKLINLPGCPMNPENLTALIVQYLATKEWPATDSLGRPLFAYGDTVHETCESLPHYRKK